MDAMQVQGLQRDVAALRQQPAEAATCFFDRLARFDPALAGLFPERHAAREALLLQMLAALCASVAGDPDGGAALGLRHAAFGVREEHYDTLGTALLVMLHERLGDTAYAASRDTWAEAYGAMAERMIAGAGG